jgi:nitrate/nitrite transporter NarK
VSQSTQNFTLAAVALLLPLLRSDLGISFTEAGALSAVTTLAYAVMQVPAGYLGDRFGAKLVMMIGLVGLNALTVAVAIAPNFSILIAVLALIGGLRALAFAPGLALVSAEFGPSRHATGISFFLASGFSTNLVVSIVAPLTVDFLGWRGVVGVFGLFGLVPVFIYLLLSKSEHAPAVKVSATSPSDLAALLTQPIMWWCAIVQFTRLATTMVLRFWLPSYLVVDKGFGLSAVALVVAIGSAISVLATLAGGQMSDRRNNPMEVIVVSLFALAAGLVILTNVDGLVSVTVVVALLYLFVQTYSGPLFQIPLIVLNAKSSGTINGFSNLWGNVGGFVLTFVFGLTKDLTGSFDLGWLIVAGMCLISLIVLIPINQILRVATAGNSRK